VYDMYPWDSRADGPRSRPPAPRDGHDTGTDLATQAVQFALDRRDNGGDSADHDDPAGHDAASLDAAATATSHGRK
jgi:hypothetical protein